MKNPLSSAQGGFAQVKIILTTSCFDKSEKDKMKSQVHTLKNDYGVYLLS
jgi:hypothetical protein